MLSFIFLGWGITLVRGSPVNITHSQGSPVNITQNQRLSKSLFDVPLVPYFPDREHGRGGGDGHHERHWDDHDNNNRRFDNKNEIINHEELSPPCKLLIGRFKKRILGDQARIDVYGNSQQNYLRSAEVCARL